MPWPMPGMSVIAEPFFNGVLGDGVEIVFFGNRWFGKLATLSASNGRHASFSILAQYSDEPRCTLPAPRMAAATAPWSASGAE